MASIPLGSPLITIVLMLMLGMPALVVTLYRDQKGMSRPQYFGWFVVCFIGVIITKGLSEINSMGIPAAVVGGISAFFLLAATVRRLTDAGWNPWLAYVAVVPPISLVFFVVLFFVPQTKADTGKQSKVSELDEALSNEKNHGYQSKKVNYLREQDIILLGVAKKCSGAKNILQELGRMGSKVGNIDLPLNNNMRELLLGALGEATRNTLLKEHDILGKSIKNSTKDEQPVSEESELKDWSEEFKILFEYDSVVKDYHDSLDELDPQLPSQFRQEVVKDRKQAKPIHDRLMADHNKKLNPYDSGDLNQAYSEARKLASSAGDEFVRIIDVMGEDVDIDSILGKLKEKYS